MEKIETSKDLRDRIVRDRTLQRDLSEKVAEILKGRIKIGEEETYTFVPHTPEIFYALEKLGSRIR